MFLFTNFPGSVSLIPTLKSSLNLIFCGKNEEKNQSKQTWGRETRTREIKGPKSLHGEACTWFLSMFTHDSGRDIDPNEMTMVYTIIKNKFLFLTMVFTEVGDERYWE